jgi:hypothetical protein
MKHYPLRLQCGFSISDISVHGINVPLDHASVHLVRHDPPVLRVPFKIKTCLDLVQQPSA